MSDDEILNLAHQAGFEPEQPFGLTGSSPKDESAYVEEYPVGERLLSFARSLLKKANGIPIEDASPYLIYRIDTHDFVPVAAAHVGVSFLNWRVMMMVNDEGVNIMFSQHVYGNLPGYGLTLRHKASNSFLLEPTRSLRTTHYLLNQRKKEGK